MRVLILVLTLAACSTKQSEEDVRRDIQQSVERTEVELYNKMISDAIDQYEIVKRAEQRLEMCLRSGMVAEAYLSSKNEAEYRRWKAVETKDCKRAGLM